MGENRAAEGGMSLAEVLVAVAILGIAIATIVSGLGAVASASSRHRSQVNGDTVIRSYAEVIKQRSKTFYQDCAPSYSLPATYWTQRPGYTVQVTRIQYLQSGGSFGAVCPSPDLGAQLFSLQAQSVDRRDTATLEIVVRTP